MKIISVIKFCYHFVFIIVRSWWYLNKYERRTGDIQGINKIRVKGWDHEQ